MSEIRTVDFQPGLSAKCVIKFNRLPDDLLYTALRSIPFRDGARDGSRFMRDTLGKEGRKSSEAPYLLRGYLQELEEVRATESKIRHSNQVLGRKY